MTRIELPRDQRSCEMQRSLTTGSGATTSTTFNNLNLLQTHFQLQRMQSEQQGSNGSGTQIDLSALYEQNRTQGCEQKTEQVNMVDVPRPVQLDGNQTKAKKEIDIKSTKPTTSASAHVVHELKKVLESRKIEPDAIESREEDMEVASSFSEQDTVKMDGSIIEQRKQRRRERNRLAAQRCRLKKRQQAFNVSEEVNVLENANKELKIKIHRLQSERDRLHLLIRKHLPKCYNQDETESPMMDREAANKEVVDAIKGEIKDEKPVTTKTSATWTVSNPTEKVSVADAMETNNNAKIVESSQKLNDSMGVAMTIESQRNKPVDNFGQEMQSPQTSNPPASYHPEALDQPLVIDLSPDRFSRTAPQQNKPPESTSTEGNPQTQIIGHFVIR